MRSCKYSQQRVEEKERVSLLPKVERGDGRGGSLYAQAAEKDSRTKHENVAHWSDCLLLGKFTSDVLSHALQNRFQTHKVDVETHPAGAEKRTRMHENRQGYIVRDIMIRSMS
ncbi:hypothetical protein PsorP6_008097 [Peronosclerospora sorghi]|uniref:Uncharacterized protein n=1 Tax=Peronosclerospora sorghi TaxID=230839 RepID=A0ACC0W8X7_9STRA|nr:hypothetical protein PsorP6_008097 [Peronosclerospora sorghi]